VKGGRVERRDISEKDEVRGVWKRQKTKRIEDSRSTARLRQRENITFKKKLEADFDI